MGLLEGRRAVVTGGASGIGWATAEIFAAEGARVLIVDRTEPSQALAPRISCLACDVTLREAPEHIIGAARDRLDGLDILFNGAGVAPFRPVAETSDQDWDTVLDVNLRAIFRLSRAAIPLLVASPCGRIVNVASVAAIRANKGLAVYSASKAGLVALTRVLATELGPNGVTVNAILPGAVLTPLTAADLGKPEYRAYWDRQAALGRIGLPDDIARVALFLASDLSAFMTGQDLVVDGGSAMQIGQA